MRDTETGESARQAVLYREGASTDEVVKALAKLIQFLVAPDERLVRGSAYLTGNELNADEFPLSPEDQAEQEMIRNLPEFIPSEAALKP